MPALKVTPEQAAVMRVLSTKLQWTASQIGYALNLHRGTVRHALLDIRKLSFRPTDCASVSRELRKVADAFDEMAKENPKVDRELLRQSGLPYELVEALSFLDAKRADGCNRGKLQLNKAAS